jgi:phospholipase C
MPPIDHLVVLMLENRSFDHLLGFYEPASGGQPVLGLHGSESNPINPSSPGEGAVAVIRTHGEDGYVTDPDPPHEHADAMVHLFGTEHPVFPQRMIEPPLA